MPEIFKIREDYGAMFLRDLGGEPLELEQVTEVVERLMKLRDVMQETGYDQYQLAEWARSTYLERLAKQYTLHYPVTQPDIQYKPNGWRGPNVPRYSGVYFMGFEENTELIKIGVSIDIYQRMKGLWSEHQHQTPIVHGWIDTEHRRAVEGCLHTRFNDYCAGGEWFSSAPVLEWLEAQSG